MFQIFGKARSSFHLAVLEYLILLANGARKIPLSMRTTRLKVNTFIDKVVSCIALYDVGVGASTK